MCIMVIVSFIMVNLQPCMGLFVFVFMAATLHFSFFKGFCGITFIDTWSDTLD